MHEEGPKIVGLDRSKTIGRIVAEYGDNQYWLGFKNGFGAGVITAGLIVLFVDFIKSRK